jgi:type VI secretion system protein ImpG
MDRLLYHYEQELSKLRQASQSFAQQHPQSAARIQLDSDPEVERLLQSIALLNARTAERIDDEHEDLTGAILNGHPSLRTFPSCAIAQIDYGNAKPNTISSGTRIPRGTMFKSTGNPTCKFRTAYDVHIAPLTISEACLAAIDVPAVLRLPAHATISLRITFESTHAGKPIYGERPLRVHISGTPSQTAAIMDAILLNSLCVFVSSREKI